MTPNVGETIGHFEILELIGAGTVGPVYRARSLSTNDDVTLKFLDLDENEFSADLIAATKERFVQMAAILEQFSHQYIAEVFEASQVDYYFYVASEYLSGETLADRLARSPKLTAAEAYTISIQIVQALRYAWETVRCIHGDLRPENIMLLDESTIKVIDLGMVKPLYNGSTMPLAENCRNDRIDEMTYLAPEQHIGAYQLDQHVDVFALGTIICELLTGRCPYQGKSVLDLFKAKRHGIPFSLEQHASEASVHVIEMIEQMVLPRRLQRIGDYGKIENCLAGELSDIGANVPEPEVESDLPKGGAATTSGEAPMVSSSSTKMVRSSKSSSKSSGSVKSGGGEATLSGSSMVSADEALPGMVPPEKKKKKSLKLRPLGEKNAKSDDSDAAKSDDKAEKITGTGPVVVSASGIVVSADNEPARITETGSFVVAGGVMSSAPVVSSTTSVVGIKTDTEKSLSSETTKIKMPKIAIAFDVPEPPPKPVSGKMLKLDKKKFRASFRRMIEDIKPEGEVGDYVVDTFIGAGTGSVVAKVHQKDDAKKEFALKFFDTDLKRPTAQLFEETAYELKDLQQRSICQLHDAKWDDNRCYFVSDLVLTPAGQPFTLRDFWEHYKDDDGFIDEKIAQIITLRILETIEFAHRKRFIHGNLKPENILFQSAKSRGKNWELELKVSDFGSLEPIGTGYAPDEDFVNWLVKEGRTVAGDLYQIGELIRFCLIGERELERNESLLDVRPGINELWTPILTKVMRKNPNRRFGSAAEMAGYIEGFEIN